MLSHHHLTPVSACASCRRGSSPCSSRTAPSPRSSQARLGWSTASVPSRLFWTSHSWDSAKDHFWLFLTWAARYLPGWSYEGQWNPWWRRGGLWPKLMRYFGCFRWVLICKPPGILWPWFSFSSWWFWRRWRHPSTRILVRSVLPLAACNQRYAFWLYIKLFFQFFF